MTIPSVRAEPHLRTLPISIAVGVILILLFGIGLRVWGLGAKSFWWDEAFTHFISAHAPADVLSLVRKSDGHPPLYYLLANLVVPVWPGEVGLRFLSVLGGTLTILGTYLLGRHLLGARAAVIAAGLVAISPGHVMASQEGRMYALMGLWVLLSWSFLWLATYQKRTWWAAYAITTTLALYTHYLAIAILISQGVFIAADGSARRAIRSWLLAAGVILALFLPWAPTLLHQITAGTMLPANRPPLSVLSLAELGALLQFGGGAYQTSTYIVHQRGGLTLEFFPALLLPSLIVLAAAIRAVWHRRPQGMFLLCFLGVPIALLFAVSLVTNLFQVRYFVILIPAYALLAAVGVEALAGVWQRLTGYEAWFRGLLLVWLGLFAAVGLQTYYAAPTWDGYDWRAGVELVESRAAPLDTVAMIPGMINIPFRTYSHRIHLSVLGDPTMWSDPNQSPERAKQRQILRTSAARNDLWLFTLAPLAEPLQRTLTADLQNVASPGERWRFGDVVIVHFAHHAGR